MLKGIKGIGIFNMTVFVCIILLPYMNKYFFRIINKIISVILKTNNYTLNII